MNHKSFGTCAVCELARCEIDDGGYLYCPMCGARENQNGWYVPVRHTEQDYEAFSRGFEACPYCGERQTRRDTDDFVYCFKCERIVVLPVPHAWIPPGAVCHLGFKCELPA